MKGSLNKGFLSYLLLFVGLLMACALIIMTIMLLSPGTSILGYCYVRQTKVYTIDTFDGDDGTNYVDNEGNKISFANEENKKFIDFSKIDVLNISANYSSVKVRRGDFSRIKVITSVKGFAKAKDFKSVVVQKKYQNEYSLGIDVQDQNYLWTIADGRVIEITLSDYDFNQLEINISTKKGDISFANSKSNDDERDNIMIFGVINASTENGNIWLSDDVNPDGWLKKLKLNTKKGDINIGAVKKFDLQEIISIVPDVTLVSENGKITTKNIEANILTLVGDKTNTNIGDIQANTVDLQIKNGIVKLGNIQGDLVDRNEVANNVKIDAGNINGSVVLPKLSDSAVTFGDVGGDVLICTKAGSVKIKSAAQKIDVRTQGGKIDIKVSNEDNATFLSTKKGEINVTFDMVKGQNDVESENGKIVVNYKNNDIFKLDIVAKNINFKSENKTIKDKATGYPSTSNAQISTTDILNVKTKGDVDVFSLVSA